MAAADGEPASIDTTALVLEAEEQEQEDEVLQPPHSTDEDGDDEASPKKPARAKIGGSGSRPLLRPLPTEFAGDVEVPMILTSAVHLSQSASYCIILFVTHGGAARQSCCTHISRPRAPLTRKGVPGYLAYLSVSQKRFGKCRLAGRPGTGRRPGRRWRGRTRPGATLTVVVLTLLTYWTVP